MPLLKGSSDEIIQKNIDMLIAEGKPREQAIAIAYENAGIEPPKQENKSEMKADTDDTIDFSNIKLFTSGKFNGKEYTKKHIEDMVAFYNDHKNILPDLKLDHIDSKDKRYSKFKVFENFPFSLGKIINLKVNGDWLEADYKNVFKPIKQAIDDKLLTTHSIECYFDVESSITKKKYSAVLSAVSLLPAGELPALMEVFKPYMYRYNESDNKIITFNLQGFNYTDKQVCNLNNKEVFSFMTEEEYKSKVKKFNDAYMKCKDFEAFMEMDDEKKDYYMKYLESNYKKYKEMMKGFAEEDMNIQKGEYKMATENNQERDLEKENFDFQRVLTENQELQKKVNSLVEAKENENKLLHETVRKFQIREKQEKVEKVLFSLIESDQPKLEPAQKDKAYALLMAADNERKEVFSVGSEQVEKTAFDLTVDFLNSLPKIKQIHRDGSIVESGNFSGVNEKLSFTKNEKHILENTPNLNKDEVVASFKIDRDVKAKYSDKIDFSKASEAELQRIYEAEGLLG